MMSTVERPREAGEAVVLRVTVRWERRICSPLTPSSLPSSAHSNTSGSSCVQDMSVVHERVARQIQNKSTTNRNPCSVCVCMELWGNTKVCELSECHRLMPFLSSNHARIPVSVSKVLPLNTHPSLGIYLIDGEAVDLSPAADPECEREGGGRGHQAVLQS